MVKRAGGTRRLAQQMMARAEADAKDFEEFYDALATTGEPPDSGKDEDALTLAMVLAYDGNVAELLDDHTLTEIGEAVEREYILDEKSRKEWVECATEGLKAATQKKPETKNTPYPNASNVKFPLLSVACTQFASRSYPAIVRGDEVIDSKVSGEDKNGEKAKRGRRSSSFANDQLIYRCTEWEKGTDSMLHALPAIGKAFRKVYWDATLKRPRLDYVSALDVCVPADAPSLELSPRITHIIKKYPYEVERLVRGNVWLKHDLDLDPSDKQKPVEYLEQCRYCDLDDDGLSEPYIVTIHRESKKVVRIDPEFDIDDVEMEEFYDDETSNVIERAASIRRASQWVDYDFLPDPEGGFYAMGFGQLLAPITAAIDTTINELLDAGHLANTNTGFLGSTVKTRSGVMQLKHNEFRVLPGANNVKDALYRMEFAGPSAALFSLLEFLVSTAKDITSIKDVLTGDAPGTQPATSTLALIEQGLQVFSAIYKRVYRSMTREFELLYNLNKRYLSVADYNKFLDAQPPEAEINAAPEGAGVASTPPQASPTAGGGGEVVPFPGGPPQPQQGLQQPGLQVGQESAGAQIPSLPGAGAGGPEAMAGQPPLAASSSPTPPPQSFLPSDPTALQAQLGPQLYDPAVDFDLSDMDIRPVADPTAVTEMQRLARAQFLDQMRQTNPYVNGIEATKRILEAARMEEPEKLVIESNPMADAQAQAQLALVQGQAALAAADAALKQTMAQGAQIEPQLRQQEAQATVAAQQAAAQAKTQELQMKQLEFDFKGREVALAERAQAHAEMLGGHEERRVRIEEEKHQLELHRAAMDEAERGAKFDLENRKLDNELERTTLERLRILGEQQLGREATMAQLRKIVEDADAKRSDREQAAKDAEAERKLKDKQIDVAKETDEKKIEAQKEVAKESAKARAAAKKPKP